MNPSKLELARAISQNVPASTDIANSAFRLMVDRCEDMDMSPLMSMLLIHIMTDKNIDELIMAALAAMPEEVLGGRSREFIVTETRRTLEAILKETSQLERRSTGHG